LGINTLVKQVKECNMPSRNIESFGISDILLEQYFSTEYSGYANTELACLFTIAVANKSLFPSINMPDGENWQHYINRWVDGYVSADRNPPSSRNATPKSSCSDPAIKEIVRVATQIDESSAKAMETYHTLFMSAENAQGGLLEEYIDSIIAPLGWIWCKGNTLRSVDFCNTNGSCLLQVKNKSNTENSSSSAIRAGTNIRKWYRLGTRTRAGKKIPDYHWDELISIIYEESGQRANLSEDEYQVFLQRVVSANRNIITDR